MAVTFRALPRNMQPGWRILVPGLRRVTWAPIARVEQVDQHTYRVHFADRRPWVEIPANVRREYRP